MKIMIRRMPDNSYTVYVPKKDLEEPVVEKEKETLWGGKIMLANGWRLALPEMPSTTVFPVTVNAIKTD